MAKVNYISVLATLLALGCASTEVAQHSMPINEVGDDANTTGSDSPGPVESLGPGDVFELKVFGEAELSGKFRVSGSGEVTLPLIGRVGVLTVGLTDLEELITERLRKYLKQPQVHVFVEGFKGRKVYVFGRVMKPGTMAYESGMSLIEVITKAGGLHDLAAAERTTITRVIDGKEVKLEVSVKAIRQGIAKNVAVYPGDIVFVPESVF